MVLMETLQFVSSSGWFPTSFTKVRLLSCSRHVYVALQKKLKVFHFPLITFGLYALLPAKIIILPKNAFKVATIHNGWTRGRENIRSPNETTTSSETQGRSVGSGMMGEKVFKNQPISNIRSKAVQESRRENILNLQCRRFFSGAQMFLH